MSSIKKQDKRELILKAATRVFARKGYHASRTVEIANEAGVAEGTLYNYFKSKEDLLISIFEENWKMFLKAAKEIASLSVHPDEKIDAILDLSLNMFGKDKDIAEVILVELRQSRKIFSEKHISMVLDFLEILESVIAEGIEKGIYRKDIDTKVVRAILFGTVEGVLLSWILSQEHPAYKKRKVKFTLKDAKRTIMNIYREGITLRDN
ncbi:MAG: TetR/AcrR family transcriptional regulator [Nitrospirae bacterium]|nr:TetR/AcrR family transcriptional regulator [Nitrospirota bacterium]